MGTSPGRTSFLFHSLFSIILLLLLGGIASAQKSLLQQTVSLTVTDKPIADVLDKLSNVCDVRFTYDPDDIAAGRRVSFQVQNMPLAGVLSKVFGDKSFAFREKGGQVIIYRDRSVKEIPTGNQILQKQFTDKEPIPLKGKEIPLKDKPKTAKIVNTITDGSKMNLSDTVYFLQKDTVLVRDTILRTDTLVVHDTQFINRTEFIPRIKPIRKEEGFFADISGSFLLSSMILSANGPENENLVRKIETTGIKNLPGSSAGIGFGYRFNRWAIRTGFYYTKFTQKFNYTYEHQTGGYFETDTIEKYYTLSGPDTSWFYITDSTWLEKQVHQYHYKEQNQFRYVEVPVSVSYTIYHGNFDVYFTGGAIAGILPSSVGSFIKSDPDYPVNSLKDIHLNTFILSLTGGTGARFILNDYAGIFSEVSYRQQLGSIYRNYPVSMNFKSFSFRLGLTIYF